MRFRDRAGWVRATAAMFGVALGLSVSAPARAQPPGESPRYGPPYRRGLVIEAGVGLALCQPGLLFASRCGRQQPGVGLRVGAGWRFGPYWQLSGAWVRQGHRPGGGFVSGTHDGGMLAARGILPLAPSMRRGRGGGSGPSARLDLGFELGLGWSRRSLVQGPEPITLRSTGLLVRPALVLDAWVLADLAIGIELAPQLNLHWRYCADAVCEPRPGDWVPAPLDGRWIDGLTVAVRISGLVFPRW